MATDGQRLARRVIETCRELGFARAGVSKVAPSEFGDELRAWLDAGKHGSMDYLTKYLDERLDPARLLDGARTVVMVADLYTRRGDGLEELAAPGVGKIARYARGRDYHTVIKKRLHALCDMLAEQHPGAGFRAFTDTAPVLERELAQRCGLGWNGKHTLTIHPRLGSYMLIGGVLTTLDMDTPAEQKAVGDHCGTCTRCIDACPTDAITPYSVDGSRCLSYATIEHRGCYPEQLAEGTGDWLFGCDICQEVCPHNSPRPGRRWSSGAGRPNEAYEPRRTGFDLLEVLGWSEDDRREAFTTSSMKRAKLPEFKRNALIVAGNQLREHDLPELRARIEQIALDDQEDELVRETARSVLNRLNGSP
ncbi:MAG: tRNA epoxyqueuosine(34) reductase QueG [Planctomycetota bacterium]